MSSAADRDSDITLIARAVLKLSRRMRTETPSGDLTPGMLGLLAALHREGAMSGVALATMEGLKPQSLTRLLASLEERGLIERRPDPGDRRNLIISISAPGRRSLRSAMRERRRWLAEAVADRLSAEEREQLVDAAELMLRIAV